MCCAQQLLPWVVLLFTGLVANVVGTAAVEAEGCKQLTGPVAHMAGTAAVAAEGCNELGLWPMRLARRGGCRGGEVQ